MIREGNKFLLVYLDFERKILEGNLFLSSKIMILTLNIQEHNICGDIFVILKLSSHFSSNLERKCEWIIKFIFPLLPIFLSSKQKLVKDKIIFLPNFLSHLLSPYPNMVQVPLNKQVQDCHSDKQNMILECDRWVECK